MPSQLPKSGNRYVGADTLEQGRGALSQIKAAAAGFTGLGDEPSVMDEAARKAYSRAEIAALLSDAAGLPGAVKGLGAMGLVGMIRRGGRTDLNMVHNMDQIPESIAEFFAQRGSMTNPSIAIAKDKAYPFALKPTLVMNPSSHAFDPRTAQANQLINRDAYTTRTKTSWDMAEHRLPKKPEGPDPVSPAYGDTRLTENFYPDPDRAASILASPRYKSLAEYERSKSGAGLLGTFDEDYGLRALQLNDHYIAWLADNQIRPVMGLTKREMDFRKMQMLQAATRSGDSEAERILRGFQNLPSEYGELKVLGELPIDRKNVSAMIVPAHFSKDNRDVLADAGQRLGIRTGYPMDLIPSEYKPLYEDITKGVVGDVQRVGKLGSEARSYDSLQGLSKKYVDKRLYYDMLEDPTNAEALARNWIPKSDAVAADAASILTAKDAYADGGPVRVADVDEEQRRRRGEHTRSYSQDRPIGSGENARSLVRGVKQWLPDIPGSVGDIADMLYAGGASVLQGQKQRSVAPLGAGPAIRRAIGKKAPLEQVEMRATPETDWWEEGARFANPAAFMSPKNIAGLGGLALAGGVPGAELGIVKPKGGNWYTVKDTQLSTVLGSLKKNGRQAGTEDFNKWLEGPLAKYIKNGLATEDDPIRKLLNSENPVSHVNTGRLLDMAADPHTSSAAAANRRAAGSEGRMPALPITEAAKAWNDLADAAVAPRPAGGVYERFKLINENHPMAADWVKNLPENSPIYTPSLDFGYKLGLDHLADELWNASRRNSDLPPNLRIKPEDFQQMGIEKAVRHVAGINKWREDNKAAAAQGMLAGPGVRPVREYAENNPKGLRWVELNGEGSDRAAIAKQLEYEGNTMGHCVGGYCDDVVSGGTKIFSLRDAKGEPHVTVEVSPATSPEVNARLQEAQEAFELHLDTGDESFSEWQDWADQPGNPYQDLANMEINEFPIVRQIKGKQNLAPKAEYTPFVLDFLNSPYHGGSWEPGIGDLETLGLSPEDLKKIPKGYAQGGLVGRQELNGAVGYILD